MKKLAFLTFIIAGAFSISAQVRPTMHQWTATITVVDESGKPVTDARVAVSYAIPHTENQSRNWMEIVGFTDSNGLFTTSHKDRSVLLGFQAQKTGYYPASAEHNIGFSPQHQAERLNPSVSLVLKKIIKPISMHAKWVNLGMPVLGKSVGFDLLKGDWIAPYGKGIETDIIFTANLDKRAEDDWDSKLIVSFPNAGDGIQQFKLSDFEKTSAFRSPHLAPESGYQPQWIKVRSRHPGEPSTTGLDGNLNFFIRVRTVLDAQGNVKSALYGKIYGDFMDFQYFLNPESNSRNMEFDPSRNLFKTLGPSERVMVP